MPAIGCFRRSPDGRSRRIHRVASFTVVTAVLGLTAVAVAEHAGLQQLPSSQATQAAYAPAPKLEGRLAIAGSDTMRPLLMRLSGDFIRQHARVKIAVESAGSSQAIREFIIGISAQRRGDKARGSGHEGAAQVTVLASSREMTDDERKKFVARYGYEPLSVPIALDAVAVYVHKSNPVKSLTLEQLDGIFSASRKRGGQDIARWGLLGLGDGWSNQPVSIHIRDKKSGTRDFFDSEVLQGGTVKASAMEEPGSASMVLAIARDPLGIGYAGVGFDISEVRAVPLAKGPGEAGVAPTVESVTGGSYPLSRALYLYVNQDPKAKFNPVLLQFLRYANSPQGQAVVSGAKAYPLPGNLLVKNQQLLDAAVQEPRGESGAGGGSGEGGAPAPET